MRLLIVTLLLAISYAQTVHPSAAPSATSIIPTLDPVDPTYIPTVDPTFNPTVDPTFQPTGGPTVKTTVDPKLQPPLDRTDRSFGHRRLFDTHSKLLDTPSKSPVTSAPTAAPTVSAKPTRAPITSAPTTPKGGAANPSAFPTSFPAIIPSIASTRDQGPIRPTCSSWVNDVTGLQNWLISLKYSSPDSCDLVTPYCNLPVVEFYCTYDCCQEHLLLDPNSNNGSEKEFFEYLEKLNL